MRTSPLLCAVLLAACAGDGTPAAPGVGEETPPPAEPGPREVVPNPSFSEVVQEIFARKGCAQTGCHGATRQAGLDLRPSAAWNALVGVQAVTEPIPRVVPGDPRGSYLAMKVEGRHSQGSLMPIGRPPLDSIDLANLRGWIALGAANN